MRRSPRRRASYEVPPYEDADDDEKYYDDEKVPSYKDDDFVYTHILSFGELQNWCGLMRLLVFYMKHWILFIVITNLLDPQGVIRQYHPYGSGVSGVHHISTNPSGTSKTAMTDMRFDGRIDTVLKYYRPKTHQFMLPEWLDRPQNPESISQKLRLFHTLKTGGTGCFTNLNSLLEYANTWYV